MRTPKNDIYKVWNGKRFQFTLNKIAQISGGVLKIPPHFQHLADEPIELVTCRNLPVTPVKGLVVRLLPAFEPAEYDLYVKNAASGVVTISHEELKDANGNLLPMILMPSYQSVRTVWCALGSYMKKVFPMPTISVTGSLGKTTAILMLENIFKQRNRVFVSGRNRNSSEAIIQRMLQDFGPDYDYHIQEVGGGAPGVVERSAKFLDADAFCFLNIMPHHLDHYKTLENIASDKLSFDRHAKDGAFSVINLDDDVLRSYPFKSRVITCGIVHKEADYVAENIRQDGMWLRMDIVHQEKRTPIRINIPGVHNAYNAVIAFAMAKEWGLSDQEIQDGFLAYTSGAIRQNIREIAGRTVYIDCFNISVDSIKSCLRTLDTIEVKEGNRRIAILGGENALGESLFSVNYSVGLEMAQYHADEFIFVGLPESESMERVNKCGHGRAVFEGARRVVRDRPVSFFDKLDDLADKLVRETKPGDVILLKGIFRLPLFAILDRAFGTSILIHEPTFPGKLWKSRSFSSFYYPDIGGSNITRCLNSNEKITIPDTIIHNPVFRIGEDVFADRSDLREVDFGRSVQNLGARCFSGCRRLKTLHVPANVIYVEQEAFSKCTALEEITFDGVLHVEKLAFSGCRMLKTARFTDSCQTIEADAFKGCRNLTIVAPAGSAAHRYALENNISFQEIC